MTKRFFTLYNKEKKLQNSQRAYSDYTLGKPEDRSWILPIFHLVLRYILLIVYLVLSKFLILLNTEIYCRHFAYIITDKLSTLHYFYR